MPATTPSSDPPLRLAGRTLKSTRHVCAFFHSQAEQNKIVMPFFKEGIERGEKVFHIVAPGQREERLAACAACGIDVAAAEKSGQLEVHTWDDRPLREGQFDGERMSQLVEYILEEAHRGFPRCRLMGQMEWPAERAADEHAIVEYEARLNYITPRHPDAFICAYDVNRHSGAVLMDILRTHPMVIVGGVLQENPLYLPPEEFLAELRQRPSPKKGVGPT